MAKIETVLDRCGKRDALFFGNCPQLAPKTNTASTTLVTYTLAYSYYFSLGNITT